MDTSIVRQETGISDLEKMAHRMVASKLFGVQNVDQAVSLMLIAQAEGMHPALAARDYHIIQGRHTLKADAMLARFQAAGGKVEWQKYDDNEVSALFSHPASPKPVLVSWDMKRASQAGLNGKDNWKKYPRQMLKARVVSDGIRLTFPGVAVGVYTPEEAQDFEPVKVQAVVVEGPKPVEHEQETIVEQAVKLPEEGQTVELITESQRKRIFAILKLAGKTQEQLKEYMIATFQLSSTKDIPRFLYDQIIDWIEGKA